ncbi:MAG: vWA domain-containing protein [Gammaproteobacteria bacterium]
MKRLTMVCLMLAAMGAHAAGLVVDPLPADVRTGDPVTVTGRVVGLGPLDLVFLLDHSGSVSSQSFQQQRDYALTLADGLAHDTGSVMSAIVAHWSNASLILPLSGSNTLVHNTMLNTAQLGGSSCVSCGLRTAADVLADSTRAGQPSLGQLVLLFTDNAPGTQSAADFVPAYTALHQAGATVLGIALPNISPSDRSALANATNVLAGSGFADVYDLADGPNALYQSILALIGFPTVNYTLSSNTGNVSGTVTVAADGSFSLPTVAAAEGGNFWFLDASNRLGATIVRGATVIAAPVPLPATLLPALAALAMLAPVRKRRGSRRP